jgi:hypothetical protein
MRRRLPWILAVLVVLVVGGAIALVLVQKPALDDARNAVDARWSALHDPLVVRYEKLDAAQAALIAAGGGDRTVSKDLTRALTAWKKAVADGDPGSQADAANDLEGQGERLAANVYVSPRLREVKALTDAISEFSAAAPPRPLIAAYNRAVRAYEDDRNDLLRKPVARVFGYDARPVLVIGSDAPPS